MVVDQELPSNCCGASMAGEPSNNFTSTTLEGRCSDCKEMAEFGNQASELFELCKKVYELTGWDNTHSIIMEMVTPGVKGSRRVRDWHNNGDFVIGEQDGAYPLYTSDYLLEKLPATLTDDEDDTYRLTVRKVGGDSWLANYWLANYVFDNVGMWHSFGYTPLIALLRLTIVLSEEGELDNDQSS